MGHVGIGKIYNRTDSHINDLYDRGKKWSLDYFETLYVKLGTEFDYYFFESKAAERGKNLVEENPEVFEESKGAIVFPGEKHGLHTRVFLTSEGLPTYEAKELGLAEMKYEAFPYDISVVVTANEVTEYFKVLIEALRQINPELSRRTRHIPHGLLRLRTGKMSSRTGDVLPAEELIKDAETAVAEKMEGVKKDKVTEKIAVGAIKYSILKQAIGKDVIFDRERALSLEGDSGPYLQYAYTRAQSVLKKAKREGVDINASSSSPKAITEVEQMLYQFPEVVMRAEEEYAPHLVVTYLTKLAGAFNSWYAKEKILDGTSEVPYKLALTKAVSVTLENGLWLLGIKVPEEM